MQIVDVIYRSYLKHYYANFKGDDRIYPNMYINHSSLLYSACSYSFF